MRDPIPMHPERLLEHTAWVRRLAERLLADTAAADDVAQETLLVALDAAPRETAATRPWLAAIARRVVSRIRRSSTRREARERAAARPEALEATDEIVARAELQRAVVDAVLALPEPYRTTVLQRYFDELSASEIAGRRGEPVETVRTRIKRGIGMLRERLGRELSIEMGDGRRRTGLGALALLVEPARAAQVGVAAATLAGATAMTVNTKVVTAALLVVGAVAGTWVAVDATSSHAPEGRADVAAAPPAQAEDSTRGSDTPQATLTEEELAKRADPAADGAGVANAAAVPVRKPSPLIEKLRATMTADNLGNGYTIDDDGPELRAALQGLQTESVDLVPLVDYLEARLEDGWLVPGWIEASVGVDRRSDSWIDAYENAEGGVTAAWISTQESAKSRSCVVGVRTTRWLDRLPLDDVRDADRGFAFDARLNLSLRRSADGRIGGSLMVPYKSLTRSSEALEAADAKLAELGRGRRLPCDATWSTKDGAGELTYWPATAGRLQEGDKRSSRPLRSDEIARLTALLERCFERAKSVRESAAK